MVVNGNGAAHSNGNGAVAHANGNGNGHHPDVRVHPVPVDYWLAHQYTMETPIERLLARANELETREQNGRAADITCHLKDGGDITCSACPVHEIGQDTRKSALCRLGREQERIEALLIAKTEGDGEA